MTTFAKTGNVTPYLSLQKAEISSAVPGSGVVYIAEFERAVASRPYRSSPRC